MVSQCKACVGSGAVRIPVGPSLFLVQRSYKAYQIRVWIVLLARSVLSVSLVFSVYVGVFFSLFLVVWCHSVSWCMVSQCKLVCGPTP